MVNGAWVLRDNRLTDNDGWNVDKLRIDITDDIDSIDNTKNN